MAAGYVRLSRDDAKSNYISIENQKLIICQYAGEHNMTINSWYEDDGYSGYSFDRPAFNQLLKDLDNNIDIVIVKDLSRLGRHNARVLLLLDEFKRRNKQLIVIDDNYDSLSSDDDTIGIKTWYNECYVKDISRKIRSSISAMQKNGSLITQTPLGYVRSNSDKTQINIVPDEARYIKMIYSLYLEGLGYRRIAKQLTDLEIPTPKSMRSNGRYLSCCWSDSMIREILNNDYYTGTLRLKKRARTLINGNDNRIPKSQQYVFASHHPPIIDLQIFQQVQKIKKERIRSGYHSRPDPDPYENLIFCKDCKAHMIPIIRKNTNKKYTYYICSRYNSKGRKACSCSHLIKADTLNSSVAAYLKLHNGQGWICPDEKISLLKSSIAHKEKELATLLLQKSNDICTFYENKDIICERYDVIQSKLAKETQQLKNHLNKLTPPSSNTSSNNLFNEELRLLISKIIVDKNGCAEILPYK